MGTRFCMDGRRNGWKDRQTHGQIRVISIAPLPKRQVMKRIKLKAVYLFSLQNSQ